ncbi:MAG: arginyltransferase [Campylobacterales bacterium]|nr:arginyltransferase [Campylobacterales bacterium]
MKVLNEFMLNDKCSYLKGLEQTTHYKLIDGCESDYCQALIERGYRRFGKMYFRPVCDHCDECQSIKIDVENFKFSKSQRRVLNKAKEIKTYIRQPSITKEHLELFDKYHRFMKDKKGWDFNPTSIQHYHNSFVDGYNDFGYEILYFHQDKLIGVDLVDILEDGISSIYFYYDPEYDRYSLGRLSLYNQILYARQRNKRWIYLGYYVKDCPSLSYKSHYEPYVTLQGRPNDNEEFTYK